MAKALADKYLGKFDSDWDALREQTFRAAEEARDHPGRHRADQAPGRLAADSLNLGALDRAGQLAEGRS